ncbi:MAG: 2-oxo acid dehydrogenase subunit E2 [Deltaproteobacteria bacterium]|nr:2-oxo acid dehydrogenase subunit E2 [Deltaproteobacteria bacterium]
MSEQIVIPKLGMTMKDAKVGQWKANEGDWIDQGQIVLVIETDKISYEVESLYAGFLHILATPGQVLDVGEPVGLLAADQEELARVQAEQPAAAPAPSEAKKAATPEAPGATPADKKKQIKISPAAKKRAEAHGLDVSRIEGSGPGGRIVREDVEKAIEAAAAAPTQETPAGEIIDGKRVKATIPMTGMRKVIADHMLQSLAVSAQLTTMCEFDMTELIRVRNAFLEREDAIGTRISYTDLFVFILARALKDVPMVNASLIGEEIKIWDDINIGVATALQVGEYESGLIVPVVRQADRKSLVEISRSIKDLVGKCRDGAIELDDLMGGTFTLTNTGVFGKGWAIGTPIINQPQSAILQTGAIVDRPVARDGEMVIRPIMTASTTFDHRVLDGAPIGLFLNRLNELIENPHLLLV